MEMFLFPSKVEYMETDNPNIGKVILEPCYFGYGTTIGNSLRRVLLSSMFLTRFHGPLVNFALISPPS